MCMYALAIGTCCCPGVDELCEDAGVVGSRAGYALLVETLHDPIRLPAMNVHQVLVGVHQNVQVVGQSAKRAVPPPEGAVAFQIPPCDMWVDLDATPATAHLQAVPVAIACVHERGCRHWEIPSAVSWSRAADLLVETQGTDEIPVVL